MAVILNIESTTTACSVALADKDQLLAVKELNSGYTHAENLAVFVEEVMAEAGITAQRLDAVAVSKGPGSYTGLRIGVATAKGLAYALNIPFIAVNTLQALSRGVAETFAQDYPDHLYCPMIDARRMEVYTALFDRGFEAIEPVQAKIIDETSFASYLDKHKVLFFGNGAGKCREVLEVNKSAHFLDNIHPSAAYMIGTAHQAFVEERFEDVAYFEPYYLKDFVATTPKKQL